MSDVFLVTSQRLLVVRHLRSGRVLGCALIRWLETVPRVILGIRRESCRTAGETSSAKDGLLVAARSSMALNTRVSGLVARAGPASRWRTPRSLDSARRLGASSWGAVERLDAADSPTAESPGVARTLGAARTQVLGSCLRSARRVSVAPGIGVS